MKKELELLQKQFNDRTKEAQWLDKAIKQKEKKIFFLKEGNDRLLKKNSMMKKYNKSLEKAYFDQKKTVIREQVRKGYQWLIRNEESKEIL